MAKSPMEGFQNNIKYVRFFGSCLKYDILASEYKYNGITFIAECVLCLFPTLLGLKTLVSSDLSQSLITIGLAFGMIQVAVKVRVIVKRTIDIIANVKFLTDVYDKNLKGSHRATEVLQKYVYLVRVVSQADIFMFAFWGVFNILTSFGMLLFAHQWVPFLPFLFPYLDAGEFYGWLITNILQLPEIMFVVPGILMHDVLFIIMGLNIRVLSGVIRDRIHLLDDLLSSPKHTPLQAKVYLRNIIQMQKEMIIYAESVDSIFNVSVSVQIVTSNILTVSGIFELFKKNPQAIFSACSSFFQTFWICILGTVFELAYDEVYDAAILSKWYLLPQSSKKELILYLQCAQNVKILTIFGVTPINMTTFLKIIKLIYTYSMMLYNFYF